MALSDLEKKYFAADNYFEATPMTANPPIFRANTHVNDLMEGSNYFSAIHNTISATSRGDAVYIVGWRFNPAINLLTGKEDGIAAPTSIGNLLATKCAAGVDVRLVLNGTLILYWVKLPWFESLGNCRVLRGLLPSGETVPPLAGRVLFDWSGANQTGSQHQKAVVVVCSTKITAFVGGMDMQPNFWDTEGHRKLPIPIGDGGGYWGWHDIGVQLEGEAAKRVLHNFRNRWHEASTLPEKTYKMRITDPQESPKPFNPQPIMATPLALALDPNAPVVSDQSVQILRSRFKYKIPNRVGSGGVPWAGLPDDPAKGGFFEIYATMKKAISAAIKYIYIEDQFLKDMAHLDDIPLFSLQYSLYPELLSTLRHPNNGELRLIFCGSGRKDPEDPGPVLRNTTITNSIKYIINGLPDSRKSNVQVWRRDRKTVHSKLMIIDDEFVSIGSANFQSRSMAGIDNEIHTAIVAEPNDFVKNLRMKLWGHHFHLDLNNIDTKNGLIDLDIALGLWNSSWQKIGDPNYWINLIPVYNPSQGIEGVSHVPV